MNEDIILQENLCDSCFYASDCSRVYNDKICEKYYKRSGNPKGFDDLDICVAGKPDTVTKIGLSNNLCTECYKRRTCSVIHCASCDEYRPSVKPDPKWPRHMGYHNF